jgi:hypothetical protein
MPLAAVHLISLTKSTAIPDFLKAIKSSNLKPLVVSKVVRWIITPEVIDTRPLLHPPKPWELLVITLGDAPLPSELRSYIENTWSTTTGIPSRLTKDFSTTNEKLLHPSSVLPLTGSLDKPRMGTSSQTLEMSPELRAWVNSFSKTPAGRNAVSMLNLLAFKPDMHSSYLQYGKAFAESIGSKRGGNAKLVGNIVDANQKKGEGWDEFALAHYPSILHFADMLASEDYQAVNLKSRVPSLRDTCILCTSEIEIEEILEGKGPMGIGERAMERREVKL